MEGHSGFVGLSPDDPIWDATVFTRNRERLQEGDVFQKFMAKLLEHERSALALTRVLWFNGGSFQRELGFDTIM